MTIVSSAPVLLLCLLSFPFTIRGGNVTNAPLADTYFETYGSETNNFGADPLLRLDQWGGRQVFLRFAITNLLAHHRIRSATLRLYVLDVGFNEQGALPGLKTCLGLYDVATSWTETGLTYNSPDGRKPWNHGPGIADAKYADVGPLPAPDIGVHLRKPAVSFPGHMLTNTSWLELDLTQYIRERVRAHDAEINLLLRGSTLARNYSFASREAGQAAQRPQLAVEFDEQTTDFSLEAHIVSDWKPGKTIDVRLSAASGKNSVAAGQWSLASLPAGSRLRSEDIRRSAAGASFLPDKPGKYRIRLRVSPGGAVRKSEPAEEFADTYVLTLPPHPRLYVTPALLASLRQETRSGARLPNTFLDWVAAGSKHLAESRFHDMPAHEGCENNSLAWLLTGQKQFLDNATAYARIVLKKPMREHFEDVHAATFLGASYVHAMALFYDWCYDELSAADRNQVAGWLKEAASWAFIRSGAPIAHNDGGARQCLLASAALALLGDDQEGAALYRLSRENFENNLLPWLNDGGQGGRSGDGGEYEGLHAFYIVKYAWMSHTATGEDVFKESPFFANRLKHLLLGWYPRRLVEKNGAFSIRQYYSPSGDHIRMGYVGDTQPYQSAAALCSRFRDTHEAQALRWLAGDWPTQWMQYTLRWAVLADWDNIPSSDPSKMLSPGPASSANKPETGAVPLAYFDTGCNTVYARSDWTDDATWVLFENSPYVSAHGSLDSGTFEIFKGDLLAARTGNLDHANVGASHSMNYLHRTIAGNCLLIDAPQEKWKGFLGGAEGGSDGGGQRTNFPLGSSPDVDTYLVYRDIFKRGRITRFRNTPEWTYAFADLTAAYNSPQFHGGELNQAKVDCVTRQLLYLRDLDTVLVFDRVSSTRPEYKKTWLLHSLGEIEILDGHETRIDEGEFHYSGATRSVLRHGYPKPVPSFGRCLSVTLLPENAQSRKIGGRKELPSGTTEGYPGDQWPGQHRHHHIKDFWVNGTNYPPGNPPESRWFGEPASEYYVPGTPDETGGRGKWRLEVSPSAPAKNDLFFHALCPRLGLEGPFPSVSRLTADTFEGALIAEGAHAAAVFFSRTHERSSGCSIALPTDKKFSVLVADLVPGQYRLSMAGKPPQTASVAEDGLLAIDEAVGRLNIARSPD